MFKAYEILDIAVRLEKNAEAAYRSKKDQLRNKELTALLTWMADEEQRHAKWFADLKKRVRENEEDLLIKEMSGALLTDFMGKAAFSLDEADFSGIRTTDDLVRTFIGFEHDTILFYEVLEPFVTDEEALKHLELIVEEEKSHIRKLEALLKQPLKTEAQ